MIKHDRIIEILHQEANDRLLKVQGEDSAYTDWEVSISPDDDMDKVYGYLQDERALAQLTKEEYPSYEEYMRARGRLDAYDKIEKALNDYGE